MDSKILQHPIVREFQELITTHSPNIILGFILICLGWLGGRLAKRVVAKSLKKTPFDQSLAQFIASLSYFVVFGFFLLAALSSFGVETTSLIAALGAMGFTLGLALQGTLSNLAAGLLIVTLRPFKVGDFITAAGVSGEVKSIGLFSTELAEIDNVEITVPNAKLYDDVIKNYSANKVRRIDLQLGISYDAEIPKTCSLIIELLNGTEGILRSPEPSVNVRELADSAVILEIRAWSKTEDYWNIRYALLKQLKLELDKNSIEIPYPQTVVHLNKVNQ